MSSLDFDSRQKGLFDFEAKTPEVKTPEAKKQEKKQEKPPCERESKKKVQEQDLFRENGHAEQSSLSDF